MPGAVRLFLLAAVQEQGGVAGHRGTGLCRAKIPGGGAVLAQGRVDFRPGVHGAGRRRRLLDLVCLVWLGAAPIFLRALCRHRPCVCRCNATHRRGSNCFPARRHAGALRLKNEKTGLDAGIDFCRTDRGRGQGRERPAGTGKPGQRIRTGAARRLLGTPGENRAATRAVVAGFRPQHLGHATGQAHPLRLGQRQGVAEHSAASRPWPGCSARQ
jgi:hypothetical protein